MKIKVRINNKEDPGKNGDITVEIKVQPQWGTVKESHCYSTTPFAEDLMAKRIGMVLRWDMWDNSKNKYAPHAIYAKEFSKVAEKYSCVNSWGANQSFPKISKSDVETIYYITIIQVFP